MKLIERAALLGPVVEHYLRLLDSHIRYLDDGQTTFLFTTRAGVRILEAYTTYLGQLGRVISPNARLFWSSRLLICKGISSINPSISINTIGKEFSTSALEDTVRALLGENNRNEDKYCSPSMNIPAMPLHEFMNSSHRMAAKLRDYFDEQSNLFSKYLDATIGDSKRVVIIDSGWAGTSQYLLASSFPKIEWSGLYFGWMNGAWDVSRNGSVKGLIFNSETYDPERPETSISLHRHLIESLFEPNAPSVEELCIDAGGQIVATGGELLLNEKFDEVSDPNYFAVLNYLRSSLPADILGGITKYQSAIKALALSLATPNRSDALLLAGKHRSADFGRSSSARVPVLLTESDFIAGETAQQRINRSLWPEGQIALEYEPEKALRIQKRKHRTMSNPQTFISAGVTSRPHANRGRVAIITRTKDRPLLLKRAAASVGKQSYADYVWVVVNDGGDPDAVIEVIQNCDVPSHQILLCSNEVSVGMEAASNIGIRASESEFLVIHDDDDSWHEDFLKRTVRFLEAKTGQKYGGVITHSTYISEEIDGDRVIEWGRWPYQDWVQHVQLSELIVENFFPPIAFMCRRSVCDEIGLFDENLPVLGDWDFAIRFLLAADIGVLPEQLAYYHHRDRGNAGAYSNSVVGGVAKHIEYNSIVRNKFIRGSIKNPAWSSVAALMAQGYKHRDIRTRLSQINHSSQQHPIAHTGQSRSEHTDLLDIRWAILQSAKDYYSGLTGLLRRFMPFPSYELLSHRIKKAKISPPPDFGEKAYLLKYPDISQAVNLGKFTSGFEHYVKYGRKEGRNRPFIK